MKRNESWSMRVLINCIRHFCLQPQQQQKLNKNTNLHQRVDFF
jgi:hypothetical protein